MTVKKKTLKINKKPVPNTVIKSEIVTLRLDPKTKFGLELLSRKQYRTLSSVVEWAINDALRNEEEGIGDLDAIWDIDDADRLIKLALYKPNLLNYEEQVIWKTVRENAYFWRGAFDKNDEWAWTCTIHSVLYDRVREYYPKIISVAKGELPPTVLPTWLKKKPLA